MEDKLHNASYALRTAIKMELVTKPAAITPKRQNLAVIVILSSPKIG
ncbi:hypothetical protein [Janthinobacterium sp. HH102]|nr:hypothetical protein [Janthinobacterium sp. HH102]